MNPTALAIAILYGAVCALAIAFLLFVWHSTHRSRRRREDTTDTGRLAHGEKGWFIAAVIGLGVLLLATIAYIPYGQGSATPDEQRMEVEGVQFAWITNPGSIRAGQEVRFRVTSGTSPAGDPAVNHGFGVYNDEDVMLLQIQVVPDHPSEITYTFKKPGTYQIVCLEFCGVGHHRMIGTFQVQPA